MAAAGLPGPLAKKPAAKTPKGSATIPNIQTSIGLIALATTLPMRAAEKPAQGPKTIPSMGSRYIAQLRHKPNDIKYNITCNAAKTPTKAMFFVDRRFMFQSSVKNFTQLISFAKVKLC